MTANQQLHSYQHGMSNGQLAPHYSDQTQPITEHYAPTQMDQLATSTGPPPAAIRSSFAVGVCTSLFVFIIIIIILIIGRISVA